MEFLYPLKHGSGTDGPSLAAAFATKSKMPDYATHLQRLTPGRLRGYLRGFIDLIFEHDGRWYVADYKSNHLGGQRSDYASDHLERTMLKHDYILQYHLYAVALVRFLRLRLPHYDPEEHFGGVYYLFLRGMTRDGKDGSGIYFDRPSAALLTELDRALTPEMMA
jgi:exodeoxyribonuclease V beta subunit